MRSFMLSLGVWLVCCNFCCCGGTLLGGGEKSGIPTPEDETTRGKSVVCTKCGKNGLLTDGLCEECKNKEEEERKKVLGDENKRKELIEKIKSVDSEVDGGGLESEDLVKLSELLNEKEKERKELIKKIKGIDSKVDDEGLESEDLVKLSKLLKEKEKERKELIEKINELNGDLNDLEDEDIDKLGKILVKEEERKVEIEECQNIGEKYVLKKKIGEGNFGKVCICTNKLGNVRFAAKIVTLNPKDKHNCDLMKRELKILSYLKKKGVKKVMGFVECCVVKNTKKNGKEANDTYYVITEYYKGGDLYHAFPKKIKDKSERCKICLQLIDAVKLLHDNGIAHRDLKLENVLLDEGNNVFICDFGMSRFVDEKERGNSLLGTYEYMSKNLIEVWGGKKGDRRYQSDDVCAISAMLYELIKGEPIDYGKYCKKEWILKEESESLKKFKKSILSEIRGDKKLSESVKKFFEKTFFVDEKDMWNMDAVVGSDFYKELQNGSAKNYFS